MVSIAWYHSVEWARGRNTKFCHVPIIYSRLSFNAMVSYFLSDVLSIKEPYLTEAAVAV